MNFTAVATACVLAMMARDAEGVCTRSAPAYTLRVPETAGTEIGVSKLRLADNRQLAVFFRPSPCVRLQWSGLGGGALALAGSQSHRYANPTMCPATPIGVGSRVPNFAIGASAMRQVPALPEQIKTSLKTIRAALRDAAIAPIVFDTLDATGDAFRWLAETAPAEVRRA